MNDPSPSSAPGAAPRPVGVVLLAAAAVFLLARVPLLAWEAGDSLSAVWRRAQDALSVPEAVRIESAVGVLAANQTLLQQRLGRDGRLVVYFPVAGTDSEKVFWEKLLRDEYERLKNLLYPTPRDATFARNAEELTARLDPKLVGRLIVVDGTLADGELPVRAEFDLLTDQRIGPVRLRFWLLRKVGGG